MGSRHARRRAAAERPAAPAATGSTGRPSASSRYASDCHSSSARCSRRAGHVARRRRPAMTAAKPGRRGSCPARPRRRRRRARRARSRRGARRRRRSSTPTPPRRSWNERLNVSSRQPDRACSPMARSSSRASRRIVRVERQRAGTDGDGPAQETVAADPRVELARPVGQRGEELVAGREADARADGRDVVEVAPVRSSSSSRSRTRCERRRGREPERRLARAAVGERVADGAGRTGPLDHAQAVVERAALGEPLEAAVLVEQTCVDVQDALADDVEAEVPGLDDARVDRADRDVVGVVAVDRDGPRGRVGRVRQQRPQRLVAGEAHAVAVVRLALVPADAPARGRRSSARRAPRPRARGARASRRATRRACARPGRRATTCRSTTRPPSRSASAIASR